MGQNINLIAFGTFGSPSGFRQTFFYTNEELWRNIKTFDLKTDAITLFPGSKVYSIRKEYTNGLNIIAYSVYTYAKERNSERGGTFIGSSILFADKIAPENMIISSLNEFHRHLTNKNVKNDVIQVDHSDKLSVSSPKDFNKLDFNLREIDQLENFQYTNRNLVVYCHTKPDILQGLLNKSIDLLNVYDTIYFTENDNVAKFVRQKGIFRLVEIADFEDEIRLLYEDRKQKAQFLISELQNDNLKLEESRSNVLSELERLIEINQNKHLQNERTIEQSKGNIERINSDYSDFLIKIQDYIDRITSGDRPETIKELYVENRRRFLDAVNELKQPIYLNEISKLQIKQNVGSEIRPNNRNTVRETEPQRQFVNTRDDKSADLYKLLAFLFALLWLITGVCCIWYIYDEKGQKTNLPDIEIQGVKGVLPVLSQLDPTPNSELSERDCKAVAKKIKYGMSISDIVQIIHNFNPSDIKKKYSTQPEEYSKKIIELNRNCFTENSGSFSFEKDTLKHIPTYKD